MQNPNLLISSFSLQREGVAGEPLYCMKNSTELLVLPCLLLLTSFQSVGTDLNFRK